jgi:arabinoxylan arabinofuranohydrolase
MKKSRLPIVITLFISITMTTCITSTNGKNILHIVKAYKKITERNPIMTHTFGADPSVLVYDERVYIYMTGDNLEYDSNGRIRANSYNTINTIRVASSADLANWVYHEPVKAAGLDGIAKWANQSWAPAIICKNIDGKDKFFLYFSNNANGIGVLISGSPLGPWIDPLGKALISRQTPNCSGIPWVFDPAVFIDDDGKGYLYFGGGVPGGKEENPGSARVVELNTDMISLAGEPVKIDVPFFFEASGINKLNRKYIFSYCTNWNVTDEAKRNLKIDNAVIAVMSANNPMGPFTLEGTLLKNPGTYFGVWGNNHHDIFEFKGKWYIAYHSQILEQAMDLGGGYRVTHVDEIKIKDGKFELVTGTKKGVEQVGRLNPFFWHQGAVSGVSAEMSYGGVLLPDSPESNKYTVNEYASALKNGSWQGIIGADFETGAKNINISAHSEQANICGIEIRLDTPTGEVIGSLTIRNSDLMDYTVILTKTVNGVHDVYFVYNSGFVLGKWQFTE